MNLNATLLAQFVVFFILAWFTMKFIWPPLMMALNERAARIADGLAAADRGRAEMAAVEKRVQVQLAAARDESQKILADAEKRVRRIRLVRRKNVSTGDQRAIVDRSLVLRARLQIVVDGHQRQGAVLHDDLVDAPFGAPVARVIRS